MGKRVKEKHFAHTCLCCETFFSSIGHDAPQQGGAVRSRKMIEEARKRNSGDTIVYRVCGIDEYEYPQEEWDCIVSNLVLHYIEDLEPIFQKVFRTLKPGGIFLFNIEHPVFTSGIGQDWLYSAEGKIQCWPVDNYFIAEKNN